MSRFIRIVPTLLALLAVPAPGTLAAQTGRMSPREVHDRIQMIIQQLVHRDIPGGDTMVTWNPTPILYTTVTRTPHTVASSLIRNDGVVGTAAARWSAGRQREITVRWTKPDSTLFSASITAARTQLILQGTLDRVIPLPSIPWAVADYGMEDQLIPILNEIPGNRDQVAVFRPFVGRWDTLTISVRRTPRMIAADLTDPAGEVFHWFLTTDGVLIRMTSDKFPELERRPLEGTVRIRDYVRLMDLLGG